MRSAPDPRKFRGRRGRGYLRLQVIHARTDEADLFCQARPGDGNAPSPRHPDPRLRVAAPARRGLAEPRRHRTRARLQGPVPDYRRTRELLARVQELFSWRAEVPVSYTHLRAHETRHDLV